MRLRTALALAVAAAVLAGPAAASAAPPAAFPAARFAAPELPVQTVVATAGAVAYLDTSGNVWATRVRADGTLGSPLPAAQRQRAVRDLQVVVTDRGELLVLWAASVDPARSAIRYAVAPSGRSFSGVRTLAPIGSFTSATPRAAALRGGTVAVLYRDQPPGRTGTLRYVRRAPGAAFGAPRSLGHDGSAPQIAAAPGGGALLAWARGGLGSRSLHVASARRGAVLPGASASVAGRILSFTLAAGRDGGAWVTWTRREGAIGGFARRTRAANVATVGPVQGLGPVAYGVPHIAIDAASLRPLAAWNAQGPSGASSNVVLASAAGVGSALTNGRRFEAGGFAQTSPLPAWRAGGQLLLFTRQVPDAPGTGLRNEVVAADAPTGEGLVLGTAATIATPAVAPAGTATLIAWPAATGGVAVVVAP